MKYVCYTSEALNGHVALQETCSPRLGVKGLHGGIEKWYTSI